MADIIDVNIGDSTLEVFWQDEVELNLDMALMYIKSGEAEIQDYVDNVSKPEISNYVETEAKPLVSQIVEEIAEPTVAEYIETTVKPEIDEYVEDKKPELQAYVTQASGYADDSQASAEASAASAAEALISANNAQTSETNAKTYENNALSSKNAAASSATSASNYANNSKIWGEGTDAQVQALGGEKSAKGWAEASTNLDYTNITNCITKIPQDIKLELADKKLYLSIGSKVYDGNGLLKTITEQTNQNYNITAGTRIFLYEIERNTILSFSANRLASGDSLPADNTNCDIFYLTSDKKVYIYLNSVWSANAGYSFPICIATTDGVGVTSIDQVFNGFVYIGSIIFALPGVEGLIPNGRNTDGSLNNIKHIINNVYKSGATVANQNLSFSINSGGWINYGTYELTEDNYLNPSFGEKTSDFVCGTFSTDSTGRITSFNPKTVFHAADYQDVPKLATDNTFTGDNTFVNRPLFNSEILMADTTGTAPDNPPSKSQAYGTLRWLVKATKGATGGYGGGQELWRMQPVINSLGRFYVVASYQYGTSKPAFFDFGCNADGSNPYFKTITPATTDNSTKAATTAFVNNFITNLSSTVGSGYVYIGNLLVQWGTSGKLSNTSKYITYPKPFANTSYSLFVSGKADDSETALGKIPTIGRTIYTTGFTMNTNGWSGSYYSYIGYWLAIGQRG